MSKEDMGKKIDTARMDVKFLMDRDTLNYGPVKKDQTITVSAIDGKAFMKNGVAKEVKGGK